LIPFFIVIHSLSGPDAHIALVACQIDRREEGENPDFITTKMGERCAAEIGATFFMELSAKAGINVKKTFDKAICTVLKGEKKEPKLPPKPNPPDLSCGEIQVSSLFLPLLDDEILSDVRFHCGEKIWHAHRFIIALTCDFMKISNGIVEKSVERKDGVDVFLSSKVKKESFEAFLVFMYSGKFPKEKEAMKELYELASYFSFSSNIVEDYRKVQDGNKVEFSPSHLVQMKKQLARSCKSSKYSDIKFTFELDKKELPAHKVRIDTLDQLLICDRYFFMHVVIILLHYFGVE